MLVYPKNVKRRYRNSKENGKFDYECMSYIYGHLAKQQGTFSLFYVVYCHIMK